MLFFQLLLHLYFDFDTLLKNNNNKMNRLFIVHFMLTDKGKEIEIDEQLKAKCQLAQAVLSLNSND